jgi:hypothetical protein
VLAGPHRGAAAGHATPSRNTVVSTPPPAGQDGSYLAEFLLQKGYVVYGLMRRSSSFNTGRIEHIYKDKHQRAVR